MIVLPSRIVHKSSIELLHTNKRSCSFAIVHRFSIDELDQFSSDLAHLLLDQLNGVVRNKGRTPRKQIGLADADEIVVPLE